MYDDSPVNVGHLFKWLTILTLFVVCGCLFVNIRTQQAAKLAKIDDLRTDYHNLSLIEINLRAQIDLNEAPGVLEKRLTTVHSQLDQVPAEKTETFAPTMTASN